MARKIAPLYPLEQQILTDLGSRLKAARERRQMKVETLIEKADISRQTLFRAERGEASVAIGIYFRILAALGLHGDFQALALDVNHVTMAHVESLQLPG